MKELKFTVECPNKLEGKNTIKENDYCSRKKKEEKRERLEIMW